MTWLRDGGFVSLRDTPFQCQELTMTERLAVHIRCALMVGVALSPDFVNRR